MLFRELNANTNMILFLIDSIINVSLILLYVDRKLWLKALKQLRLNYNIKIKMSILILCVHTRLIIYLI